MSEPSVTVRTEPVISVAGVGCVAATGVGVDALLRGLRGEETPVPGAPRTVEVDLDPPPPVFEVPPCAELLDGSRRDVYRRSLRLARLAAREALGPVLDDAVDPTRFGVVVGGTVGGMNAMETWLEDRTVGLPPRLPPRAAVRRLPLWDAAFDLARRHGLRGPALAVSTACTSGSQAIACGADLIRAGVCDAVLAGGVDVLSRLTVHGFGSLGLLDAERCRPFDAGRAGLNLGEGAAFVVLRRAEPSDDGVTLLGWAATSEPYHQTAPSPDGVGLARATEQALGAGGVSPESVDWVHAHGTATRDNDRVESRAIRRVFGDSPPPVSSTKHLFGHTLGAAGALATAAAVVAIRHGFLPGNASVGRPDPEVEVDIVPPEGLTRPVSRVVVDSLGFGGTNCVLVLGRGGGT